MKKLATAIAALGLLAGGSVASACTLSAWSSQSGTAPTVGGPGDPEQVARYSGICAMQADSGTQFVQDDSPAAEGQLIARFYFLVNGTGNTTVYEAFADEGAATSVFSVAATGSTVTVTPASGSAASASMDTGWNSVEVSWASGGAISLWVNSDATSAAADSTGADTGSATVEAIQFGAIDGLGGFSSIVFDDYESRRTTAIGRTAVPGDADADGVCTLADAVRILNEFLLGPTATTNNTGTPDRDEDGAITLADAVLTLNAFLTSQC